MIESKPPGEHRILIVEDEPLNRQILYSTLHQQYDCFVAESAEDALKLTDEINFSLIITDIILPKMSGLEFMNVVSQTGSDTVFMVMSAETKIENAVEALRLGAFDYLVKPLEIPKVKIFVKRAIEHFEYKNFKNTYERNLEEMVEQRTIQYDYALEEIDSAYRSTLKSLVRALETKVFEPIGHHDRVMSYCIRLGKELNLDASELHSLELGALLHDIGKIGVADAIVRKYDNLTDEEIFKIQLHPIYGEEILRDIPFLDGAIAVVAQHHEWWNGKGYPRKLKGEQIDFKARIFSVIDAFDALTSDRSYRDAVTYEKAREEIIRCAGTQFDPMVVEAFCDVPETDWEALFLDNNSLDSLSFQSFVSQIVDQRTENLLSEVQIRDIPIPPDIRKYLQR